MMKHQLCPASMMVPKLLIPNVEIPEADGGNHDRHGKDGLRRFRKYEQKGAAITHQDKATCVVETPEYVAENNLGDAVSPLNKMLCSFISNGRK